MKAKLMDYENVFGVLFDSTSMCELADRLKESALKQDALMVKTDIGEVVIKQNNDSISYANAENKTYIFISLSSKDYNCLINAIEQYFSDKVPFPFDYSLESARVRILPEDIKDIVIESTWRDYDTFL